MSFVIAALAILAGCLPRAAHVAAPSPGAGQDDIVLFRDAALVRQHVAVDVGPSRVASVDVRLAAGVTLDQVALVERGGLEVRGVHAATPAIEARPAVAREPDEDRDGAEPRGAALAPSAGDPAELRLEIAAPRPGRYTLVLAYPTTGLQWDAAYTMTLTPRRDRAEVRGALAIRNTTAIPLHARVRLIDAELGATRARSAELLATDLAGVPASTSPAAAARELGVLALPVGETRVELLAGARPRAVRSVLVYDPIGTRLDNHDPSGQPLRDPSLGTQPSSPRLTESLEITRDSRATVGLPAGPVRLLERHADGSLAVLGEARLFDPATRAAAVDTIAVGTAAGVTGRRVRRELSDDEQRKRLVEEIEIAIDNKRDVPANVLLREHMYRGLDWNVAYYSSATPAKEGPQQIALRAVIPPHTRQRILYVVVYTWP